MTFLNISTDIFAPCTFTKSQNMTSMSACILDRIIQLSAVFLQDVYMLLYLYTCCRMRITYQPGSNIYETGLSYCNALNKPQYHTTKKKRNAVAWHRGLSESKECNTPWRTFAFSPQVWNLSILQPAGWDIVCRKSTTANILEVSKRF